ncbi:MAG: choice-of-anchor J domain-containing protein [Pseudomonadota bacterium]
MKTLHTLFAIAALGMASCAQAGASAAPPALLTQGFDDVGALGGWLLTNQSSPAGQTWFQGNSGIFAAHAGPADSYIAANFLSAQNGVGTIDNWLISPELQLTGPTRLSFYTRGAGNPGFADRLEVRFSAGGGADPTAFTQTLLAAGEPYPDAWQRYTATVFGNGSGRFAFRYTGPAGGADYIGLDSVSVAAVPEPAGYALFGAGLALLGALRARGRRAAGAARFAIGLAALGAAGGAGAAEPPDGMVVVRDAETGALRPPTAAEYKALQALEQQRTTARERGAAAGAPLVRKPDGTLKAHLGHSGAVYSVATRDADGEMHIDCLPDTQAARDALGAGGRPVAQRSPAGGLRHAID